MRNAHPDQFHVATALAHVLLDKFNMGMIYKLATLLGLDTCVALQISN